MTDNQIVAKYLQARLEQFGLDRLFGVAGNYTAAFLDTILADKNTAIKISGNANEICAGFAADGYARYRGIGAIYVTYSVGAFTALNTIAGAFVEQIPLVLINGAPTSKETSIEQNEGILFSHTTGYKNVDIDLFRPITVAAERITNAAQAPYQIDSALTAMWTKKKPVYLEVAENVWRATCPMPQGRLISGADAIITVHETGTAVQQTLQLLGSRPKVLFWAGAELIRFGLQKQFQDLLEAVNQATGEEDLFVGYTTSASSKSVLSEDNRFYRGTFQFTNSEIDKLAGSDGTFIGLGSWLTGKNTGNESIRADGRVFVSNGYARVGTDFYSSVMLRDYMEQLTKAIKTQQVSLEERLCGIPVAAKSATTPITTPRAVDGVTFDNFFIALGKWITADDIIVVDAGFSGIGAVSMPIRAQGGFVAQASWLSIGYSIAAATGVKCANSDKRVVVIVGDGAFQETCQAVSDHHAHGHNTIVFVMANGLYGIEQEIVNPNVFRCPPTKYMDPLLNAPYKYNTLPKWNYDKVTDCMGGRGLKASTVEELQGCLVAIEQNPHDNFVVEVTVPELSIPSSLKAAVESKVGEDETENSDWPPKDIF